MKQKPYVLQVCGLKNTGKTTFMNGFIAFLKENGYAVGTIKHDGHEFETSHQKEDNFQHYHSGANTSIVFSNGQYLCIQREKKELSELIQQLQNMDIILIEGCKNEAYPKVELLRKGVSEYPVSNPVQRLACIVDESYEVEEKFIKKEDPKLFQKVFELLCVQNKKR